MFNFFHAIAGKVAAGLMGLALLIGGSNVTSTVVVQQPIQQETAAVVAPTVQQKISKAPVVNTAPQQQKDAAPATNAVDTSIESPPIQTSLTCNGKTWSPCPTGQQFYCPAQGDAQCAIPQNITNAAPSSGNTYLDNMRQLYQILTQDGNKIDALNKQINILEKYQEGQILSSDEMNALTDDEKQAITDSIADGKNWVGSKISDLRGQVIDITNSAPGLVQVYSGAPDNTIHCTSQTNSYGNTTYTTCN